ncbi:hypothetical protein FA13DRAFT_1734191 [Coprinellus micaceus]|uniref:Uncharacterized protein n=1 Tax=Coprinellus micaceus TaxID=71717 RepID=A0A4Y7T7B2_COPMI|nr:hypothetical protein FA13DRAFT_1734191 [Coprinellus micaceus]
MNQLNWSSNLHPGSASFTPTKPKSLQPSIFVAYLNTFHHVHIPMSILRNRHCAKTRLANTRTIGTTNSIPSRRYPIQSIPSHRVQSHPKRISNPGTQYNTTSYPIPSRHLLSAYRVQSLLSIPAVPSNAVRPSHPGCISFASSRPIELCTGS